MSTIEVSGRIGRLGRRANPYKRMHEDSSMKIRLVGIFCPVSRRSDGQTTQTAKALCFGEHSASSSRSNSLNEWLLARSLQAARHTMVAFPSIRIHCPVSSVQQASLSPLTPGIVCCCPKQAYLRIPLEPFVPGASNSALVVRISFRHVSFVSSKLGS